MGQIGHPDSVKISHSHWGKSDMANLGQIGHNKHEIISNEPSFFTNFSSVGIRLAYFKLSNA